MILLAATDWQDQTTSPTKALVQAPIHPPLPCCLGFEFISTVVEKNKQTEQKTVAVCEFFETF